jgi:hypothetical protein
MKEPHMYNSRNVQMNCHQGKRREDHFYFHISNNWLDQFRNSKCTVAYRPTAKRWFCKQQPLLGNARNSRTMLCNLFLSNGLVNMHVQHSYCWKRCFLFSPCKVVTKKTIKAIQLGEGWQFSWTLQGRLRRDGSPVQWRAATVQLWKDFMWAVVTERRLSRC